MSTNIDPGALAGATGVGGSVAASAQPAPVTTNPKPSPHRQVTRVTSELARGRWPEILLRLGVPAEFLTGRHSACPFCGGVDRWRFTDHGSDGWWICNQCGRGRGIDLVMRLRNWTFRQAADAVDEVLRDPAPRLLKLSTRVKAAPISGWHAWRRIEDLLETATDPEVVTDYLSSRGLSVTSPVLRGHQTCPYFAEDDDGQPAGAYPAVLAPVIGPDGQLKTVHRIYDAPQLAKSQRKKTMRVISTMRGGAVRLFDVEDDTLAIAEGVETSLAVRELFGLPVWSCLTANGIKTFEPPAGLRRLHVYADNDRNAVGQLAAYALQQRAYNDGLTVDVRIPDAAGTDWLDELGDRQ
jgi:putative DNA primase/helicase